jgi:5-dehydro-2-deoxygluconokinase
MSIGYNKPLHVQPFDHRGSFQTKLFGWKVKLTDEQTAEIAASKKVIYEEAVAGIARRYRTFVDDFESAKGAK